VTIGKPGGNGGTSVFAILVSGHYCRARANGARSAATIVVNRRWLTQLVTQQKNIEKKSPRPHRYNHFELFLDFESSYFSRETRASPVLKGIDYLNNTHKHTMQY
jgi:hypothetical protein